jgi:hypothetical protein
VISGWATGISPGPANESTQSLLFEIASAQMDKFASVPGLGVPSGDLSFTLAPDANGVAVLSVTLVDNGGTSYGGEDTSPAHLLTITINPVNDPPVGVAFGLRIEQDTGLFFQITDFTGHFIDVDGDSLDRIKISQLPAHGDLFLDGVLVALNQEISLLDLDKLLYFPDINYYGADSFQWYAHDGLVFAGSPAQVSLLVEPVCQLYLPLLGVSIP